MSHVRGTSSPHKRVEHEVPPCRTVRSSSYASRDDRIFDRIFDRTIPRDRIFRPDPAVPARSRLVNRYQWQEVLDEFSRGISLNLLCARGLLRRTGSLRGSKVGVGQSIYTFRPIASQDMSAWYNGLALCFPLFSRTCRRDKAF